MSKTGKSTTSVLFEELRKLYKQGQLLLMDSDRLMGDRGWTPIHNSAVAELSNSLNSPQRWYARWAMRFYEPASSEEEDAQVDRLLFVSIHFASDSQSGFETNVDEPLVCAGRLIYAEPMTSERASDSFDYWMCKYWFKSEPQDRLEGWRRGGQSQWYENLKASESFAVPLYSIASGEKLRELVIDPLVAAHESES